MPIDSPRTSSVDARLRLFVAIELPPVVIAALAATSEELKRAGVGDGPRDGVRWVRPDGIHLTLKFLGETSRERVAMIIDALRDATADAPQLDLRVEGIGAFGGSRLRVLHAGVVGDIVGLHGLERRIGKATEVLGFGRERDGFSPHLTLLRVRDDTDQPARDRLRAIVEPYIAGTKTLPLSPPFCATHVSLMQSTLHPSGAVYRTVEQFDLV